MADRELDRREFLIGAASLAALASSGVGACSDQASRCSETPLPLDPLSETLSRVAEVHDPLSLDGASIDAARVRVMLERGLLALSGQPTLAEAWQALLPDFSPTMRIGIKINTLSSKLTTSKQLLLALIESLVSGLGASAERIWVWDRRTDELARAGLTTASLGVQAAGTVTSVQDPSGPGYERTAACVIDGETHLSRILTAETDVTINLALLKTHNISGITGALKNVYGCIDNPGEFHAGLGTKLPALYRLDPLRQRCRLHLTEALQAVIKGDTTSPADTAAGRLLLSADPLALDSRSLALVNELRAAAGGLPPLPVAKLTWLDEAARLNLGRQALDLAQITI